MAESWRQARNQDLTPLLWLVESAELRGAYQKSLKYLDLAEQLDRLNPAVVKMRLRLLTAAVLRHFRQRKPHLAADGIDRIAALPEGRLGRRLAPAVAGLRAICSALRDDSAQAAANQAELKESLGEASFALLRSLAEAAGLTPHEAALASPGNLVFDRPGSLAHLASACALGDMLSIEVTLPGAWETPVIAALSRPSHGLDAGQMLLIGEAALRGKMPKPAYQASAAGLQSAAADARFLLLRGRALPPWTPQRSLCCLRAALALARRDRETELTGRILDLVGKHPAAKSAGGFAPGDRFALPTDLLQQLIAEERAAPSYPESRSGSVPAYVAEIWRREETSHRPHSAAAVFDEEEEDEEETEESLLRDLIENAPPKLRKQMMQTLERGERLSPELISLLAESILSKFPITDTDKSSESEQGSLF